MSEDRIHRTQPRHDSEIAARIRSDGHTAAGDNASAPDRLRRYRAAEQRLFADAGIDPTEHWVDLPSLGVTARVLEVGEGTPTVFLHQGYYAAAAWSYVAARVTGVRCLLVDRPGCGLSDPRAISTVQELLSFLEQLPLDLLDGLGLDRACLVGASIGGHAALRSAATHPQRNDRLALVGCPPMVPGYTQPLILNLLHAPVLGQLLCAAPQTATSIRLSLKQFGQRRSLREGRIPPPMLNWIRTLFRDTATMRNEAAQYRPVCDWRGRADPGVDLSDDELAAVQAPCVIVAGTADPIGGPKVVGHLADLLPSSTLELLPDAGHFPWFDDPARVAAHISDFLGSNAEPQPATK